MGGGRGDFRAANNARVGPDRSTNEENAWRAAARNGLLLIAVWCLGSMVMRITDLVVAVTLNYPFSRYDSMVLAAFDLVTAVLAIWLRINLANDAVSREADLVAVRTCRHTEHFAGRGRRRAGPAVRRNARASPRKTRSTETISPNRSPASLT